MCGNVIKEDTKKGVMLVLTKACQDHPGWQAHWLIHEGVTQSLLSLDLQKLSAFSFGKWMLEEYRPGGHSGPHGEFKIRMSNIEDSTSKQTNLFKHQMRIHFT